MKERVLALAGGVISLLLVIMILTPLGQQRPPEISLPSTADRGDAGLKALKVWLEGNGVSTLSHRRPLTALPEGRGSLLIMSVPGTTGLAEDEPQALRAWVERGNHLLVLSAYASAPRWRELSERSVETSLAWLELELGEAPPVKETDLEVGGGQGVMLEPMVAHPLVAGIERVHVPPPAGALPGEAPRPAAGLSLALLGRDGRAALWWLPRGEGTVLVSAYAGLFSHVALDRADNARLAANLVNQTVAAGGSVIFDDYRFGLDDRYDPEAFFADPRLHATLAFVLGFWLLYVVGHSGRLGPPRPAAKPSTARQFGEGVAGLLARRIPRAELRERLWHNLLTDLSRRYGAGDPWAILGDCPTLAPQTLEQLRRLRERCDRGAAVDDEHYARLLIRIRESTL